jgi:hypothetical protein
MPSFSCPTGYNKFGGADQQDNILYGCRKQSSPPLAFGAIAALLGPAQVNPALALGSPTGPQTDKPTITGIQVVAASPGNAPRPNSNVLYAGEDFQVDVTGNLPNKAGYQANKCSYTVEVQNIKTGKVTSLMHWDQFDIDDTGAIPAPGEYRVHVTPYSWPKGGPPACLGKADLAKVTFYPKAAWVTGLKLIGFAYHFNAGDAAGLGQFCENCTSIFSPAHDRAFLGIAPTVIGSTPGGQGICAYNITQTGDGGSSTLPESFKNGQPAVPTDQQTLYSSASNPPFWNMYNNDTNTITVSLTSGNDGYYPSCNILGGKITKTITWTKAKNPDGTFKHDITNPVVK